MRTVRASSVPLRRGGHPDTRRARAGSAPPGGAKNLARALSSSLDEDTRPRESSGEPSHSFSSLPRAAAVCAQLHVTTSPTKRRKVSPSSPGEATHHSDTFLSAALPRSPTSFHPSATSPDLPPSYIPSHLQFPAPGTPSHSRSPTPATATAGLTLASDQSDMNKDAHEAAPSTNGASRSPSPGDKRPASEIDDSEPEGGVRTAVSNGDQRPSIDEQIARVQATMEPDLRDRQKGFVVAMSWMKTILARSSAYANKVDTNPQDDSELGPVDNSGLVLDTGPTAEKFKDEKGEPFVPLRPGLKPSEDFEVVPQEGWDLIQKWYGLADQSPVIVRYAHNVNPRGEDEHIEYEIYPQIYTIYKLVNPSVGFSPKLLKEKTRAPVKLLAHASKNFQKWLKEAKKDAGIEKSTKVRVWKVAGGIPSATASAATTPAVSRTASPAPPLGLLATSKHLILDPNTFLELAEGTELELLDEQVKDQTDNPKYNGSMTMRMAGLVGTEVVVLEEQVGSKNGKWASEVVKQKLKSNGLRPDKAKKEPSALATITPADSARSTPVQQQQAKVERVRPRGPPMGKTGMDNLGNTCFLNAATQCLRNVEELTCYLLSDKFKQELNFDNALGYHGACASAYVELLGKIHRQPPPSSVVPRPFLKTMLRCFNQWMEAMAQHDSQEFLLALMDGIAEDLNRIVDKPYIPKSDSTDEMVTNREALEEFAAKTWHEYKVRNDSVIVDLFAGMYKSSLTCRNCDKTVINFEPFLNLTLPIPSKQVIYREVFVQPVEKPLFKMLVEVDIWQPLHHLRDEVARRAGLQSDRLVCTELYRSIFHRMHPFDPSQRAFDVPYQGLRIGQKDQLLFTELDGPVKESTVIPVFNRFHSGETKSGKAKFEAFGIPFVISIREDEFRDVQAVYSRVMKQVATMTSQNIPNVKGLEVDQPEQLSPYGDAHPLAGTISRTLLNLFDVKVVTTVNTFPTGRELDSTREYPSLTPSTPARAATNGSEDESEASAESDADSAHNSEAAETQSLTDEVEDDSVLPKQGDALVLDWKDDVRDALFTGDENDPKDIRDMVTFLDPDLVFDSDVMEAKVAWEHREAHGMGLDQCLFDFGKEEVLDEGEQWECPRCKEKTRAQRKFDLWSSPDILVVHLKRFYQVTKNSQRKLQTLINFPLEGLDMRRYITGPHNGKPLLYDLIGVDNHMGSMSGGHYTAYCKNFEDGRWYSYNDGCVDDIENSKQRVVSPSAYILFYRRRSSEPLGGPAVSQVVKAFRNPSEVDEEAEGGPFAAQNGISKKAPELDATFSSSDEESDHEPSTHLNYLDSEPSWSFGPMTAPSRLSDDEHDQADDNNDLFEEDSNVAVGSDNGDRLQDLDHPGPASDHDLSFEEVPPLQEDGSEDELPVKELTVGDNEMTDM
ncbi:hypothetical protein N7532_003070 [Penicillium argentinense]|uniref:ubiquitinyl hydrolase 1 n=1 Tax=Penicillium argentinense TaxID=1131581 RepID=A0A9W9KE57_9EURO|nr:uncharacterized protein N7532_003070 [Penicillium argentinense]KAJ5102541.1 hypothetical protein N7532_003070 [Penicillium argentinense]